MIYIKRFLKCQKCDFDSELCIVSETGKDNEEIFCQDCFRELEQKEIDEIPPERPFPSYINGERFE
jgi:hypothetical protein